MSDACDRPCRSPARSVRHGEANYPVTVCCDLGLRTRQCAQTRLRGRAVLQHDRSRDRCDPQCRHWQDESYGPVAAEGGDHAAEAAQARGAIESCEESRDMAPSAVVSGSCCAADPGVMRTAALRRDIDTQWSGVHAVRTRPGKMPLADLNPRRCGFLLLRAWDREGAALLSGARAVSLPVGLKPGAPPDRCDPVGRRRHACGPRKLPSFPTLVVDGHADPV